MSFVGTILLLASLVSAIMIPIFVGHGLAVHDNGKILLGLGFGLVSAVFVFLFSKFAGEERTDAGH